MQFSMALRQEAARVAHHTLEEVQLQDIEIGWFDASKENLFKSAKVTNLGRNPGRIGYRIMITVIIYQCLVNHTGSRGKFGSCARLDVEHWTPSSGACKKNASLSWKRLQWGWI